MLYWRISSFPELEHLSQEGRKQLLHRSVGAVTYAKLIVGAICWGVVFAFLSIGASDSVFVPPSWRYWLSLAAFVFITLVVYISRIVRIRGQLLIYLQDAARRQRLPLCLRCGYNLEGIDDAAVCPECGGALGDCSRTQISGENR